MHGVLELVGAGLGVALVPASTSLLAIEGVVLKALQRPAPSEVLALLRRKVDANPMLPVLEAAVASIFDGQGRRLRPLIASAR